MKLPIKANKHSAQIPEQGVTLGSGVSRVLLKDYQHHLWQSMRYTGVCFAVSVYAYIYFIHTPMCMIYYIIS